jgi:phenylacetate-coenzyme A ligase PaaK-like adenylate-forming protein
MLNLETRMLEPDAFGRAPFTFLDQEYQNDLTNIVAINLIENGNRAAREIWQNGQLTNVLRSAQKRSKYWRQRLPSRLISHDDLKYLPIQTREDIAEQVRLEGSLVATETGTPLASYTSSGSSGTPVRVFYCPENSYYNSVRSLAQLFLDNISLDENRVRINQVKTMSAFEERASKAPSKWAGPLSNLFRNGTNRSITYRYDDAAFIRDLMKAPVGYLNCQSRHMQIIFNSGGTELIKRLGIKLWLHLSDYRDPLLVQQLADIGIPSLSNYSCAEVGPIAYECQKYQGYFHVAHSNVIVESDETLTASFKGVQLQRLLVTHLHSYATPIVRYDLGDFGVVETKCKCGHDGTTISGIYGRGKHFLRHPDGRLIPFYVSTRLLDEAIVCKEYRFRQSEVGTIKVQIGGRESITGEEKQKLIAIIHKVTNPAFKVEIEAVKEIDWSDNPKQLLFSSSVV